MIDAGPSLDAARGMSASALVRYLAATGWTSRPARVDGISIYSKSVSGADRPIEFILPTRSGFSDEQRRIADALRAVGAIERKSLATLSDEIRQFDTRAAPGALAVDESGPEVYVIEGDPAERDAVAAKLARAGFHVTPFADGPSAVAETPARAPACIIMDVHMPGDSGLDLLGKLKSKYQSVPVLLLTGHGDMASAIDAIKRGAFDYIEMNRSGDDLAARVRDAIKSVPRQSSSHSGRNSTDVRLTLREREILALIAEGGELRAAIDKLRETMADPGGGRGTLAIVNLAESLQGLIHHMRSEQQMIRDWVDAQAEQHRDIRRLLETLVHETQKM